MSWNPLMHLEMRSAGEEIEVMWEALKGWFVGLKSS